MNKIKFNFRKLKNKKGFTFIEILGALVISSFTIILIAQLTLQVTRTATQADASDRGILIAANTSEALLKIRQTSAEDTTKNQYSCVQTDSNSAGIDNYIYPDPNDPKALKITPQFSNNVSDNYPVEKNVIAFGSTSGIPMKFIEVKEETPGDKALYFRAIKLSYSKDLKLMTANISIYWSLYGKDNFYNDSLTFSLSNVC